MRIIVNDIAASSGGAMSILKDFYNFIRQHDTHNEWIFLLGDHYLEPSERIRIITLPEIKKSRLKKLWFDCVSGKKFIASLQPDTVFSLQNIITFGLNVPQVLYIHQSIPFQNTKRFSFFKKEERIPAVYQHLIGRLIKRSAKKASHVIVQTQWMKDAVCKQCKLPQDRISAIAPNVLCTFDGEAHFDANHFFYPTADSIYKNNDCIRTACSILEKKGLSPDVQLTLPKEKSAGPVHCVGRLPREQVMQTYRNSTLLFPSYIETFGYPLAEARAAGTMILASDCPFSRELLAGYENARFFDPFKPEELAQLMEQVMTGHLTPKPQHRSAGATHNSWQDVVTVLESLRVLFLTNIPSPYRMDFFRELGKQCSLTVLFEKASSAERDASWNRYSFDSFRGIILKGYSTDVDKAFAPMVTRHLKGHHYHSIIVSNVGTPTGVWALEYLRRHHIPYYIEGDGALPGGKGGFRAMLKRRYFTCAKGCFSTSDAHDQYYRQYNVPDSKLIRYPFTSLRRADLLAAPVSNVEKQALRQKLGISETQVLLAIGQFIPRKGFDILIRACAQHPHVGCYLVGGTPPQEYLDLVKAQDSKHIHFIGFKPKDELSEYFRAADLFVHPTRLDIWGLVINEAMAYGLPLITTDRCIAGLELVKEGVNGFIIPTEDENALADRIGKLLSDPARLTEMGEESLKIISGYTIEAMVRRHMDILEVSFGAENHAK